MQSIPCAGCKNACLSELLGTYVLVFVGPASVIVASMLPSISSVEALTFVATVFACTVGSIILILGRHSGAHVNPAITLANVVAGAFKRELFLPYVFFQVTGGLLAGLSLFLVFRTLPSSASLGSTKLAVSIGPLEGFALEVVGTFLLATSALAASSFVKRPAKQAALVGTTLFALIVLIGPLTGASFNPARSLGPSIFSGYHNGQIIYWIGPLIGAAFAGSIFGLVKSYGRRNKDPNLVCMR